MCAPNSRALKDLDAAAMAPVWESYTAVSAQQCQPNTIDNLNRKGWIHLKSDYVT
jgi:hypothetical protein